MSLDQEAISVATTPLSDEALQSAPAGSATKEQGQPQAKAPGTAAQTAAPATANTATAGEQQPQDTDAQPQEPARKPGVQKRIDELTRERYEAQRQAAYWQQQAQARAAAAPAQEDKPAPKIEDFQDLNQFLAARDQWVAEKVKTDIRKETEVAQRQNFEQQQHHQRAIAQQQTVERFVAQEQDAATRYPDYLAAVQTPLMQEFKQARPDVAQAVIDSPHGPDIVYFLAKNPAQVQQIASLNPIAAAREIGRIEQMFMGQRNQTTQAPPPARTVGGNAQAERKPEDMTVPEYRKWRQSQGK